MAALLAITSALWHLLSASAGLTITRLQLNDLPVTLYRPATPAVAAVVITHGFAGSRQLMQPFAVTLARNGYLVVTFDFPGHGRNSAPLPGSFVEHEKLTEALLAALDRVVPFARSELGDSSARLALLGHSMGADIVLRYARSHPAIAATVAVSPYVDEASLLNPPSNLLLMYGALEPASLIDQGYTFIAAASDAEPHTGVTYGDFSAGTARRLALSPGVEHVGVLYSRASLTEALSWLNQVFGQQSGGFVDARGPWLGLLYLGLVALAWPLAQWLPRIAAGSLGSGYRWSRLLVITIASALLTPLLLWPVPTDWLPILIGDYLALHFGLCGLLTGTGIALFARRTPASPAGTRWQSGLRVDKGMFIAVLLAVTGFYLLTVILPTDRFVTSFVPGLERLPLLLAILAGMLPWFVVDEWLTRGAGAPRGAYAFSKVCFLLSLIGAIALKPAELFFLVIILPVILVFFVVFGLFSSWIYRRTRHPLVAALANAFIFAWVITAVFPVTGG
jgi:pimeloyl-ACP methyl ester carboxylesterase